MKNRPSPGDRVKSLVPLLSRYYDYPRGHNLAKAPAGAEFIVTSVPPKVRYRSGPVWFVNLDRTDEEPGDSQGYSAELTEIKMIERKCKQSDESK